MSGLGELRKVELRSVWGNEAQDFTPWLAKEKNLAEIGKIVGMELELVAQEKFVGSYRADILCKDTLSQNFVLIENQLEKTDHNHLGQILTYAAGLKDVVAIVWIASRFTDEHRAALDWLNEITAENYGFFALEIELWRIGDSAPAPKFNVVCRPNDWRKTIAESSTLGDLSETKLLYHRYWTAFRDYVTEHPDIRLQPQKPRPQHWTNLAIGRSGFSLSATASVDKERIGAVLYIKTKDIDPKVAFATLQREQLSIEKELGFPLEWQELPDAKACRISVYQENVDVTDEAQWTEQFVWLAEKLDKLRDVLEPRIRKL